MHTAGMSWVLRGVEESDQADEYADEVGYEPVPHAHAGPSDAVISRRLSCFTRGGVVEGDNVEVEAKVEWKNVNVDIVVVADIEAEVDVGVHLCVEDGGCESDLVSRV